MNDSFKLMMMLNKNLNNNYHYDIEVLIKKEILKGLVNKNNVKTNY